MYQQRKSKTAISGGSESESGVYRHATMAESGAEKENQSGAWRKKMLNYEAKKKWRIMAAALAKMKLAANENSDANGENNGGRRRKASAKRINIAAKRKQLHKAKARQIGMQRLLGENGEAAN